MFSFSPLQTNESPAVCRDCVQDDEDAGDGIQKHDEASDDCDLIRPLVVVFVTLFSESLAPDLPQITAFLHGFVFHGSLLLFCSRHSE